MLRRSPPREDSPYRSHHKSRDKYFAPSTHHKSNKSPYSNQKQRHSSPYAHSHDMSTKILNLEYQKQQSMKMRKYSKAEKIDQKIKRAKSLLASSRVNKLIDQQKSERRSLSQAHKRQIRYFGQTWSDYFSQLRQRQSLILRCFKEEQEKQVFQAQLRVRRRCQSLHMPRSQIIYLKQKEIMLRKSRDFSHLKHVKKQLAEAMRKQRREKTKIMQHFAELQEERLSIAQSKKYSVLVHRLQQYRNQKERIYLREQKRLKQKYKNVMQQLRHQQTLELEQTNKLALAMQDDLLI